MTRTAVALLLFAACGAPAPAKSPARIASLPTATPATMTNESPPERVAVTRPERGGNAKPEPILTTLTAELTRSLSELGKHADPPYFASYELIDGTYTQVEASFGVLEHSSETRRRDLDVDVRVGGYTLDNTHAVRDHASSRGRDYTTSALLPIEDDDYAIRTKLWLSTDAAYKRAAEQLQKVQANARVTADSDDKSADFSQETPDEYLEAPHSLSLDRPAWEQRLRTLSARFRSYPELVAASVTLIASNETQFYVSSEGTRYQFPVTHLRVMISARATADDGMELHRNESFDVTSVDKLPSDDQIAAKIDSVAKDLVALRKAPLAEPYLGPAILEGKAAGVFFHEVFGHRIEGHRQKNDNEGQTFTKKVGQQIMPTFLSVYDDPTIATLAGHDLNGFYRLDDEGTRAQKASLVEHGVLTSFLLGRSPVHGFPHSNGHGRRSSGYSVVSRQGNLIVEPSRTVDHATLVKMLIEQVKQQGKPYGLIIRELDGGFTLTQRFEPQSFKLLPVMVSRIYPDGREELLRGADLEGTPLRALADITAAGDDVDTFNGYCGAESGFVPVSATSPSLLVAHVELAKKAKTHDKPPILPAPSAGGAK